MIKEENRISGILIGRTVMKMKLQYFYQLWLMQ